MTPERLKLAGLIIVTLYLAVGPVLFLWEDYLQDVDAGEGVTQWVFWWALPVLAALPVIASIFVRSPESSIHPNLFRGLVFGVAALWTLLAGWILWVPYVLAPELGDSVYRWWTAVVILLISVASVIPYVPFRSAKEDVSESRRQVHWKSTALNLAACGLMLAALAVALWVTTVDAVDIDDPVYLWAVLLSAASLTCWAVLHWKRTVVGAFIALYAGIVLALAVDALEGSPGWRFWALIAVFVGVIWASWFLLDNRFVQHVKRIVTIGLVVLVFASGVALFGIVLFSGVLEHERGLVTDILAKLLNFLVKIGLPAAGMVGGIEIAQKLSGWLGLGDAPNVTR